MGEMRKITVEIPAELLAAAQAESGAGVTETVRQGLAVLKHRQAFRQMQALRGKVKFSRSYEEMREDEA
jgi:hypothetical protein